MEQGGYGECWWDDQNRGAIVLFPAGGFTDHGYPRQCWRASRPFDVVHIFDRLVIFHNKDGFTQKIIRFHPDRSYLDQHNFDASHNYLHKLDKDFSGYLEYLEVTVERKAIIRVVNGKSVRTVIWTAIG